MTASPTAIAPSPTGQSDGSNALAVLFASMHRQLSSPPTAASAAQATKHQQSVDVLKSTSTMENKSAKNGNINNNNTAAAVAMIAAITSKSSPSKDKTPTTSHTSSVSKTRKQKTHEATPEVATNKIEKSQEITVNQFLANLMNGTPKDLCERNQKALPLSPTKSSISASTSEGSKSEPKKEPLIAKQPKVAASSTQKTTKTQQSVTKGGAAAASNNAASFSSLQTTPVHPTKIIPSSGQKIPASKLIDKATCEVGLDNSDVQLRNLETWHDEDEEMLDESYYQELVDIGNTNGWSADEMFKYNENRHKITSSYTDKTLGDKYTTPLPKIKSKTTVRMATKLAKEIEEDKLQFEDGRVTPESSDDDEMFELERNKRNQLKQLKQLKHLDQLRHLKAVNSLSIHSQNGRSSTGNNSYNPHVDLNGSSGSGSGSDGSSTSTTNGHGKQISTRRPHKLVPAPINNNNNNNHQHNHAVTGRRVSNKSSSHKSNSSNTTPVTASLSSSPTLNHDSITNHHQLIHNQHQLLKHHRLHHHHQVIKPPTSSSRNILRTCLT